MRGGVIITAGAKESPRVLMRSGICEGCEKIDLKGVGKNLQDHPVVGVIFEGEDEGGEDSVVMMGGIWDHYLGTRGVEGVEQGILGTAGFGVGGFFLSPFGSVGGMPDIQVTVFPRLIDPSFRDDDGERREGRARMLVTVALLDAEGRLRVRPEGGVEPEGEEYLTERDTERMAWGVEEVRRIFGFEPLSSKVLGEVSPGSDTVGPSLLSWVRENVKGNNHWAGSCR